MQLKFNIPSTSLTKTNALRQVRKAKDILANTRTTVTSVDYREVYNDTKREAFSAIQGEATRRINHMDDEEFGVVDANSEPIIMGPAS